MFKFPLRYCLLLTIVYSLRAILCKIQTGCGSAILKILIPFNMLSPKKYKSDVQSSFS